MPQPFRPETTALVLVDHQVGTMQLIKTLADGYQVQAVLDISGSPFELSEEVSRKRMELAGVQFTATNTIIAELAQDWSPRHAR